MYRVIQRNQKKLLAVFGVLLMIVFIIPPAAKYGSSRADTVVAHVGKDPVYNRELADAKEEWQWLGQFSGRDFLGQRLNPTALVMGEVIAGELPQNQQTIGIHFQAQQIAKQIAQQIDQHPELFLLLQKEAQRNGIDVSADEAAGFMVNRMGIPMDSSYTRGGGPQAVRGMLLVVGELRRLMDATKISQPVWQREVADNFQRVRLNVVDFRAGEFLKNVPAPTTQQLQEQFDKYKNTPPREAGSPTTPDNPLGFGYQVPSRVTLQYIEIPRAQVVDAIRGPENSETRYQWTQKAAAYYLSHQQDYRNKPTTGPATVPATQASTEPATSPATTQVASTQPEIKPFEQVRNEIIDKLIAADVDQQLERIEHAINSRLSGDWIAIRRANPAATQPASTEPAEMAVTRPTAAPASQPADDSRTLAHLEQIRADVEQQFHVPIRLHEINEWQDAKSLAKLPGIGDAHTANFDTFPQYALNFVGRPGIVAAGALQVWEPSQALTDSGHNAYVFRLTAAQPAHAPPDMTPLIAQITADWQTARSYELAKQSAQKLLDSAKSVGLSQAARTDGQSILSVGPFAPDARTPSIPGFALTDPAAQQDLVRAAKALLQQATPADKHPESLIELPTDRRVLVSELGSAELFVPEAAAQYMITLQQKEQRIGKLAEAYFNYNNVIHRLNYTAESKS